MSGRIAPARAIRRDLTARQGLTLAVAALTAVAVLDLLDGSLGIVFGVGFALTVITVALWSEPTSLFIAGIAPPFLMLGAITLIAIAAPLAIDTTAGTGQAADRKSTRLNSSHVSISYAVFCLKNKSEHEN